MAVSFNPNQFLYEPLLISSRGRWELDSFKNPTLTFYPTDKSQAAAALYFNDVEFVWKVMYRNIRAYFATEFSDPKNPPLMFVEDMVYLQLEHLYDSN